MRKFLKITAGIIVAMLMFQNCQKSDFLVITGVVRDANTNLPIEGAYVVWQNEHYTRTASDGTFSIDGVKPGKADFYAVSFNGYNEKYKSAIISEGRVNKLNFELIPIEKPQVETGIVSNITLHEATITGSLHWKTENWSQYGFCWSSVNTEPTLSDGYVYVGSSSSDVTFSYNLTNLVSDQIYYVRAYASSNAGIIYGNSVVFRTSDLPISNGLIAYYPFTGNFDDQSGNSLYLYGPMSLTTDRFGLANNALTCQDWNYAYNYSNLYNTIDQFSISFWFYKTTWEGDNRPMFCSGYPSYTNEIRIGQDAFPNNLYFDIRTNSNFYKVSINAYPSVNTWHHVVAIRNSSQILLYLDGTLAKSMNCSSQTLNLNTTGWGYRYFFIGFDVWTFFRGKMDEVRLYNRPLKSTEIQYLYTH
jgi:predicted small secreted protein